MKKMATVFVLILALAASAHAKAYFAPKAEMIAKSDVIAVVNITAVEFLEQYGNQLAKATIHWHLSYRPIKDGSVEWYKDETSYQLEKKELEKVLHEVRTIMKKPPTPK